jgi:hypothetical protein
LIDVKFFWGKFLIQLEAMEETPQSRCLSAIEKYLLSSKEEEDLQLHF